MLCCRDAKDIDDDTADVVSVTATSSLEVIINVILLFASCSTCRKTAMLDNTIL